MSRRASHFYVIERQNQMIKNGRVMPFQSWGKTASWDILGRKLAILAKFQFFLPIISINLKGQTNLKVNWTQIDHFSLQKNTKIAISQNPMLCRLSGVVVHSLPSVQEVPSSNPDITTSATHLLV